MRIIRTERAGQRIAMGIAGLVAVALLAYAFMALWTESQLRAKIAAIRAAGDPASIADLAPTSIPPEENGAAILAELAPRLDSFSKAYGRFYNSALGKKYEATRDRGELTTEEQISAIRTILDQYSDLEMGLAEVAASDEYASVADVSLDSQKFLNTVVEKQSSRFRTALRLMAWRMEVLEAEGKHEQAAKEGIAMLKLARLYDQEPLLVNMLVACAVRGIVANSLYDVLAADPVSPTIYAALDKELLRQDDPLRMVHAMKTERAFAIDSLNSLISAGPQPAWLVHSIGWPMKRYLIGSLDYLNAEIATCGQPWYVAHQQVGRQPNTQSSTGHGVLTDLAAPATQAAYNAEARTTAVLRTLRIYNALRQFAEKNGREAKGLDELDLPKGATMDPFSGSPLKLKHTKDGWIVYSVMENGVDDGGDFIELKDFGVAPARYRLTEKPQETAEEDGESAK